MSKLNVDGRVLATFVCLCVLAALHTPARAAILEDLFNGAALNVGTVSFHDWELVSLDVTAGPAPDLSLIEVLPLNDDPLNPGIEFVGHGQLSAAGINSLNMVFRFTVSRLLGGPNINGAAMELTGASFSSNSGIILISEAVTDGGGNDLGSPLVFVDNSVPFSLLTASTNFLPRSQVVVEKDVFVTGLTNQDDVSVDSFTQRFSLVPEPGAAVLLLSAWASLAIGRRR